MAKPRILIVDHFDAEAVAWLEAQLDCEIRLSEQLRPRAEDLMDIDGLLIRSRTKVDRSLLDQAKRLRIVVTATSGFEHVDFKECQARKIKIAHCPEANVASAAELTILLMLAFVRRLPQTLESMNKNQWRHEGLRGRELRGQNLGIFGLGRIGQRVARLAQAFEMKVSACDPYQSDESFDSLKIERLGLSEILVQSDIISLHVPLTKETKGLINGQTLGVINPEAVIINASRGGVVDENEVITALDEGRLKGAALDVFEREPLIKESRLRARNETILTPHIGAFTEEAVRAASFEAVKSTADFFKGGACANLLPLAEPWFHLSGFDS